MKTKGFIIGLIICFVVGICVTTIVCEIYSSVREITNLCSYEQEILNAQEYRYRNNLKIINNKEDLIDLYNTKLQSMYDKQNSLRDMLISESNKYSDINNQSEKMQQTLNELQESYFNLREEINNIEKDTLLSSQDKEILINKANKVILEYESKLEKLNFWLNSFCINIYDEEELAIISDGLSFRCRTLSRFGQGSYLIYISKLEILMNIKKGSFNYKSTPKIVVSSLSGVSVTDKFWGWVTSGIADSTIISGEEYSFEFNFYYENGNVFNIQDFSQSSQFIILLQNFYFDSEKKIVYADFSLEIYI